MKNIPLAEWLAVAAVGTALAYAGAKVSSSYGGSSHMKAMVATGAVLYVVGYAARNARPVTGYIPQR